MPLLPPQRRKLIIAVVALTVSVGGGWLWSSASEPDLEARLTTPGEVPYPSIATNSAVAGTSLPKASLLTLDEKTIDSSELVGKPLILNFWYSTCEPCRREMPVLTASALTHSATIRFVGINMNDSIETATAFAEKYNVSYDIMFDPSGSFIGALGNDHAGETLLAALNNDHVDTSAVRRVAAPTGRALIGVSDDGENSIIVIPGANHAITIDDLEKNKSIISQAKVLLCQLEVKLEVVQRAFELAGSSTVRILNPAPAQVLARELLSRVDVIIPNEHEVNLLGGTAELLAQGVKTVVVTRGAKGALLVNPDGATQVDPFKVTPIDSTGAGDAFCGMLAARLAVGESMHNSLRAAVISGALATTIEGAVPSLPIWSMVQSKLES